MTPKRIVRTLPMALVLAIILHCIELAIGVGIWIALDRRAAASVAGKIGTDASWSSIESYIAEQFTIGTSRAQLLEQAAMIGVFRIRPFFIGPQYCEAYYFLLGPFLTNRAGPWSICFDDDDIVTSVERFYFQ
ncbi:MAG: hypothetical protein IT318_19565 [Anaerolineales bacterium]|nr:hypothetical protein [Anaerolineales bacterium]